MSVETLHELKAAPPVPGPNRAATRLSISGMTCSGCARNVTEAVRNAPGVLAVNVSLDASEATVTWAPGAKENVTALIEAVEAEGYGAKVIEVAPVSAPRPRLSGWLLTVVIGLAGLVPMVAGEWFFGLGTVRWFQWLSFGLAAAVQVLAGARFYRGAWAQLKVGSSNMDTLVALGSSTAFLYSTWVLFSGAQSHLYFMEAAAIITLVSAGHWMESRTSERASSALKQLLKLAPAMARRRNADGSETEVPVALLRPGDLVMLRPGDRVPADSEVMEGASAVDESMLTGEAAPVDKKQGDLVYAGTVNINGRLLVRVTAVGEETALAHIIAAVQRAQNSRANIQRIGDRVSSVFVPIVATVALLAALWWGLAPESAHRIHSFLASFLWPAHPPEGRLAAACIIAASVLIVACPCAMGLATPAAIMAASNAAARRGILIRDGVALEKAGHITTVVFDKTGTLTSGKPVLVKSWQNPSADARAFKIAAALGRHSTHPVSQALVSLSTEDFELGGWQEVSGAGIQAGLRIAGVASASSNASTVRLGSLRWLRENGVVLPSEAAAFVEEWTNQGASAVGLACNSELWALFAVRDILKPGAMEVVGQLQQSGLKIFLVTGDNPRTAAAIAKQIGIVPANVLAEARPEEKAKFVQKLQSEGERVAFIGDGINDAPVLEQADLGIAVSRASDIAREAADIVLLNADLEAVPVSLGLACATLRTIKQNLFWAFFYNAAGVPLAALGFMSPILCAAAMGLSDLVVIGNALRLTRWGSRRG